jgi:flagellar motor component MotA
MKRDEFINKFTDLAKRTLVFTEIVRKTNVSDLEDELEDLDDEDFKWGLRHVVDGFTSANIDEIFTNKISFEKDELARQYRTAMKRAILGVQAGENPYILVRVLLSYVNLTKDERKKIEAVLIRD